MGRDLEGPTTGTYSLLILEVTVKIAAQWRTPVQKNKDLNATKKLRKELLSVTKPEVFVLVVVFVL